jgi:hypothetical protein
MAAGREAERPVERQPCLRVAGPTENGADYDEGDNHEPRSEDFGCLAGPIGPD